MKWASTWASSPRSTIRCVQNDFWAYGTFSENHAPILRHDQHHLITDWIGIPLEPRHLGVPTVRPKWFSELMICLAQTVHLSCIKISTISKQNETSIHLSLVTYPYHQVRPKWFLSLWYDWRKLCTYLAPTLTLSPNRPKKIPHDPRHLGVLSGASKIISEPVVRSAQIMYQSCVKISTISKRSESSFHLSLIT
jgi:hypothetical protein